MPITLPGLASGLDVNAITTALVNAERAPITDLQTRQSNYDGAAQTITAFSTKLNALATAARALSTADGFASFTASSSDTASVAASASGGASAGVYNVTVSQLAREQRTFGAAFGASNTALGFTGSLGIDIGAAHSSVTVAATDTLTDIAAKISASGARVSASVFYTGSQYKLLVRGLDSGAANAVSFTETGTSLGLNAPGATYQAAQDAQLQVEGVTISRPTNQVTGVVPGVTLALSRVTASPVTVTVGTDTASVKTKISALVSAYNEVVNQVHVQTGYGSTKPINMALAGDSTMRRALSRVQSIVGNVVAGTSGRYTTLGSVGLQSTRDGTLTFDASKFDAAVQADPTSVARLFVNNTSTGSIGAMKSFSDVVDSLTLGPTAPLSGRVDSFKRQSKGLTDQIARLEEQAARYQQQLQQQFTTLDQQVSLYKSYGASLGSLTTTTA